MSRKELESSDRGSAFLGETGRTGVAMRRKDTKKIAIWNLIMLLQISERNKSSRRVIIVS